MYYKRLAVLILLFVVALSSSAFCEHVNYYCEMQPDEHFQQYLPQNTFYSAAVAKTHYDADGLNGAFTLTTTVSVDGNQVVFNTHSQATDKWYSTSGNVQISTGYIWEEYEDVMNASGTLYYRFVW